jgi:hypothetical protein
MTATIGVIEKTVFGNKRVVIGYADITEYTTGGEIVNASSLDLRKIDAVEVVGQENGGYNISAVVSATGGYTSTSSFKLYSTGGTAVGTQTTSEEDIGTIKLKVTGY